MRRVYSPALLIALVGAVMAVAAVAWWAGSPSPTGTPSQQSWERQQPNPGFHGSYFNPPQPAPDFTLIDQYGRPFRLSDKKGDVVVLFFGYTTCPDVCPGTLAHYRQVRDELGPDADRVHFVFITVDPQRDTPERLGQYIKHFHPSFIGLSGTPEQLRQVWADYGVYVERVEAEPGSRVEYWVNHTSLSYVIDTRGNLALTHFFGMPSEHVTEDIRRLLDS